MHWLECHFQKNLSLVREDWCWHWQKNRSTSRDKDNAWKGPKIKALKKDLIHYYIQSPQVNYSSQYQFFFTIVHFFSIPVQDACRQLALAIVRGSLGIVKESVVFVHPCPLIIKDSWNETLRSLQSRSCTEVVKRCTRKCDANAELFSFAQNNCFLLSTWLRNFRQLDDLSTIHNIWRDYVPTTFTRTRKKNSAGLTCWLRRKTWECSWPSKGC